jgi:hypothetical protein
VSGNNFLFLKGISTGIMMSGHGLSAFVWNYVTFAFVNPQNKYPTIKVKDGLITNSYFTKEVYYRVKVCIFIIFRCQ